MNNDKLYSKLWNSCNELRGKFDVSEYKYILLTIIFIKFANDAYNEKIKKIEIEFPNITNEQLQIELKDTIKIPKNYHWDDLKNHFECSNIHKFIDELLTHYEHENKKFNFYSLWKNFYKKFKNNVQQLEQIIQSFDNENFSKNLNKDNDLLGNCYEYFLKKFGENSKKSGEFYTPKTIVELMVKIIALNTDQLKKKMISIYDPTIGSAGIFIQSANLIKNKQIKFYGQEINDNTYTIATMNLAIRGLNFNLGNKPEDTLLNDLHKNKKFDIVLANPPFNLKINKKSLLLNKEKWKYGIPSENKGNYFFLQHMINKMADKNSIMSVLLDNGSQSSISTKKIRENILKNDLYEVVIQLPENIFFNTNISATLYVLKKDKANKNNVLFIDASTNYVKNKTTNELNCNNIKKIINVYNDFINKKHIDISNFAICKTNSELIQNSSNLSPSQYINYKNKKINHKVEYKDAINDLKKNINDIKNEFEKLIQKLTEEENIN